jgi:hypothetical protein
MWSLDNRTPFGAERTWVRDQNGAEVWVVAVRGSFTVTPDGESIPSEVQEEPCLAPQYTGEPGKSSLVYDFDLVRTKPTTDVILHGQAYAPNGQPTTELNVSLKVENIHKTLRIYGDRAWKPGILGLTITPPEPFLKMPIIYERAYGGIDTKSDDPQKHGGDWRNPVGVGFAMAEDHLRGQRLPNIEDPNDPIKSWTHRPRPVGFGPIPREWSARSKFAGTYDEKWEQSRHPLPPLDFDDRFFQCAPEDQWTSKHLKGGEWVELKNLTPQGFLRFRLPRIALGFESRFASGERIRHRPEVHTVILEPDVRRIVMVWQSTLRCPMKEYKLLRTVITRKSLVPPLLSR